MKKNLFFALAAVATLASCSQEMGFLPAADQTGNEITFSAYAETAVTRANQKTAADFYGDSKGIGVFAFYQPANEGGLQKYNSYKFATPDFMYNQKVTAASADAAWTYSPVKYWPNNNNDLLSFFAYAPYNPDMTWEDMNIKTDVKGTKMIIDFPIYADVEAQEDYMFAAPVLNNIKQKTASDGNLFNGDSDGHISFTFNHITAQVNLFAGVEQNTATNNPTQWTDDSTEIEIKSILFKKMNDKISISYDPTKSGILTATKTDYSGDQEIELTTANFYEEARMINKKNYITNEFKPLNDTATCRMFLAPQQLNDVYVTYTVTTTDKGGNAMNNSEITNCIKVDLSQLKLEAGKRYNLKFLIGMNSVKVVATLVDWKAADNWNYTASGDAVVASGDAAQVDVPKNN